MSSSSESHSTHDLNYLLAESTKRPMTPAQEREQRISFVFGNVGMSNSDLTRAMVEDVVDGKQATALNPAPENQPIALNREAWVNPPALYAAPHKPEVYAPADTEREHLVAANDNVPERERAGDWMQTFTGRQFWPMDPRADEIFIEDIAHSLAMQCRYAGHCLRFFSVAEHAVLMARWFLGRGETDNAKQALHHDDPETYLVDVPRPVKPFLPGYKQAEQAVWLAVAERFGLLVVISQAVHEADGRILADERAQNMAPCSTDWNLPGEPLGVTLQFWTPEQAEAEFLATYYGLIETGSI